MLVEDSSAALELVYFNADPVYLKRLLPQGSRRLVSGKLESYDGWLQMPHPDHVVAADGAPDGNTGKLPLIEPIYPLTAGLTNTMLRKAIGEALRELPTLPDWMDQGFRARQAWPSFAEALQRLHAPQEEADFLPSAPARGRGLPMTSFSPISSPLPSFASGSRKEQAAPSPRRASFARRSWPLFPLP